MRCLGMCLPSWKPKGLYSLLAAWGFRDFILGLQGDAFRHTLGRGGTMPWFSWGVTGLRADPSTQINLNSLFLPKSEVSEKLLQADTVQRQDRGNHLLPRAQPQFGRKARYYGMVGPCLVGLRLSVYWWEPHVWVASKGRNFQKNEQLCFGCLDISESRQQQSREFLLLFSEQGST